MLDMLTRTEFRAPWVEVRLSDAAEAVLAREERKAPLSLEARQAVAEVERRRWRLLTFDPRPEEDAQRVAFWRAFDFALELAVRRDALAARAGEVHEKVQKDADEELKAFRRRHGRKMVDLDYRDYMALCRKADFERYVGIEEKVLQPLFEEAGVDRRVWREALEWDPAKVVPEFRTVVRGLLWDAFAGFGQHFWARPD